MDGCEHDFLRVSMLPGRAARMSDIGPEVRRNFGVAADSVVEACGKR